MRKSLKYPAETLVRPSLGRRCRKMPYRLLPLFVVTEIVTIWGSSVIAKYCEVCPEDIREPFTSMVAFGLVLTGVKVTLLTQLATVSRYV